MKTHYKTDPNVPPRKRADKLDAKFRPRAFDAVALEVLG